MGSKIFLVLGLLVAMVLLISMEVAARDLAETFTNRKQNAEQATETNGVDDSKYAYDTPLPPTYGSPLPPGYGSPLPPTYGTSPPGGGYGPPGGGNCRYGCCGGGYYGTGCTCCTYAGEAVEANTKAKPHN